MLTDFDGTAWLPDPTTEAAAQSFALSPPEQGGGRASPPSPSPRRPRPSAPRSPSATSRARLLPLPPTTVSVDTDADLVPGFGAVQPVEAAPGLTYTAVARVPVDPPASDHGHGRHGAPRRREPRRRPSSPPALAPYLQLPAEPAAVVALAHQIVAGAKGPPAEAAALARWFDSGRFRYTLSPPRPDGPRRPAVVPLHHPGRVLSAVRGRLRRAGPDRRPAHAGRGRVHDRRTRRATAATGSPGPTPTCGPRSIWARRRAGPRTSPPRLLGRGHRRRGELGRRSRPPQSPGPGPPPPRPRPSPPSAAPSRPNVTGPVDARPGRTARGQGGAPPARRAGRRGRGPVVALVVGGGRWSSLAAAAGLWVRRRAAPRLGPGRACAAPAPSPAAPRPRPTPPPRCWPSGATPRRCSSGPGSGAGPPRPSRSTRRACTRWPAPSGWCRTARHRRTARPGDRAAAADGDRGPGDRSTPPSTPTPGWPPWPPGPATGSGPCTRRGRGRRRAASGRWSARAWPARRAPARARLVLSRARRSRRAGQTDGGAGWPWPTAARG